jgi:RHS repeat-associated protein
MPFGEEIIGLGNRTSQQGYSVNDNVRQKFTQKERDVETGLDYFGARYYGSSLGRFTGVDPLLSSGDVANPQSWNRYIYTYNNPLNMIDIAGLWTWGEGVTEDFKKQFKAWLKDVEKARDAFKPGSKEYNRLNDVIKAYGSDPDTLAKGAKPDGPAIRIATTTPDGREVKGGLAGGEFQNGKLVSTSVTFNPNALSGVTAFDVAHEGTHLADYQRMADSVKGGVAGFTPTDFELESNGIETEQIMAIGLKVNHSKMIPSGDKDDTGEDIYINHYLYKTSWGAADETTLRNVRNIFLEKSKTYQLTPTNPGNTNYPGTKRPTKKKP